MIYRLINIAVFRVERNGNRKYITDARSFGFAERVARDELRSNADEDDSCIIAIVDDEGVIRQEVERVSWRRDQCGVLSYFIEEVGNGR